MDLWFTGGHTILLESERVRKRCQNFPECIHDIKINLLNAQGWRYDWMLNGRQRVQMVNVRTNGVLDWIVWDSVPSQIPKEAEELPPYGGS